MTKINTNFKGTYTFKNWQELPWKEIMTYVRVLQDQIVRATDKHEYKEVYDLQRKLVTSFEGRALAVRNVSTSSGAKTPGIDNITWKSPADRMNAIIELGEITKNPKSYKASPLKRVMIPKTNSKELRPLGIPTIGDRAVQAVYQLAVDPVVETKSDTNSYGFRKGRSQHDAIAYIRSWLDKNYSPEYILETDIAKCFDKINHEYMLKNIKICDKNVLEQWLKCGYIYENKLYPTTEGTPQGGIISPMLCNAVLNGLESKIREHYPLRDSKGFRAKVYICRFADDLIITANSKEILIDIKTIIKEFLEIRDLEMKETKTRIVHINEGFDFLGFNISRKKFNPRLNQDTDQDTVLIIKPSKKAIDSINLKIKETIENNPIMETLVKELNPIIRGWGNYFKISYHSQAVFIKIGHSFWTKMMSWVKNKHPRGSLLKNIQKYIVTGKTRSNHKWVWGVNKKNWDIEKENKETIINIAEITPVKHSLLKLDRNPYRLEDRTYFEKRAIIKIEAKHRAAVYKNFKNICILCVFTMENL